MHKSQVLLCLLLAFVLGVFIGSLWLITTQVVLVLCLVGVFVLAVSAYRGMLARIPKRTKTKLPWFLIGCLILFFALGLWRFYSFQENRNDLTDVVGSELKIVGYVGSEPEIDGALQRFVLVSGSEKIMVTVRAYPKYQFGDFVEVTGTLKLPQNFTLSTDSISSAGSKRTNSQHTDSGSTEFDYVTYLKKDGIWTIFSFPKIEKLNNKVELNFWNNLNRLLYREIFEIKNKFQRAIDLSTTEPNAAFISGILLGSRQNISEDLREAFNKTGTTHILAISGYNIMIISEAILIGLTWFFRRQIAFWISVVVIILFVILTGASASVVRAATMGLLLSFAHGYGRLYDQKNSIIFAGAAMIWFNPMVLVFDIGFQLSFAAVLGLVYLYPYIDYKLYKVPKLGIIRELILMTLSAQLAVLPLVLYYFGSFSLFSLPANVLILPFLPAAMLMGFLAGLGGLFFLPLGQLIGYFAWAITTYQIFIIKFFASVAF